MARRRRLEEQPTKTAAKAVRAPKRMRATELALEPSMVTAPARMSPPPTLSVPSTPDLPWVARYPARIQLGLFPTPIEKLERLGCSKSIVGLVVPSGYSFNLDGTAIYLTIAALFVAQATNTPLTGGQEFTPRPVSG